MQEMELQNDNMYLRNKVNWIFCYLFLWSIFAAIELEWIICKQIAENERAQQTLNMLPVTTTAAVYDLMPPFDSRNFLQVNLLDPNRH